MICYRARSMFSSYLDGALTGRQMQALSEHLARCASCNGRYLALRQTQSLVSSLGKTPVPPELSLRLKVALSHAASQRRRPRLEPLWLRLQDIANAFMLPATAGVASAVIFFGLLIGILAMPSQLLASRDDVPTLLYTPPQLRTLPADVGISAASTDSIVVETYVDANGRVQDYRIISGPSEADRLLPELNNIMIFTIFRPATTFGVPTAGRAVLSFAKINVKG